METIIVFYVSNIIAGNYFVKISFQYFLIKSGYVEAGHKKNENPAYFVVIIPQ